MRQQHRAILAAAVLAAAGVVVPPRGPARADQIGTSSVDVSIPRLATIQIAGDISGLLSLNSDGKGESSFDVGGTGTASLLTLTQDGTGETAYDAGFAASAADAIQLTLDSNKQWQLGAAINTWTDPAGYDKAESDLEIQITNTPTGTVQAGADSYIALAASNTVILDHTAGVSDNQVDVQARVLLDWTQDIPGTYAITITWTMENTP